MDLPVSPKSPKRQVTLGPNTPIQEWEVERATLVMENKEFREKAERLEKKVEEDLVTYEKNTSSLLKEVKLKESLLEKKLKDVEEQLTSQILELQRQLDTEKTSHQEDIQNLKHHHEIALDAEDKKHQRRITSLQERLKAKDTEYTELLEKKDIEANKEEETKKEKNEEEGVAVIEKEDDERDKIIQSLKLELEDEKNKSRAEQEKWQKEFDNRTGLQNQTADANILNELEELQSSYQQVQDQLKSSEKQLQELREREQQHLDRIEELESTLSSTKSQSEQYQKRIAHIVSGHDAHIREITEKFNTEAQRAQMSTQAQFQNLQSEHNDILRELREQQENEKEVWLIEKKDAVDKAIRTAQQEKEEAIRVLNREWKDRLDDLQASVSKDSSDIQAHWESKLEEQKSKSQAQVSHLLGEMEVVKYRLGREIERRKLNESNLADTINLCELFKARSTKYETKAENYLRKYSEAQRNLDQIRLQYRSSHRLALDLLAVTSSSSERINSSQNSLPDILQNVIRNASIMRVQRETNTNQLLYEIDAVPTIGF